MQFFKRYYDKLLVGILLLLLVVCMAVLVKSLADAKKAVEINDKGIVVTVTNKPSVAKLDTAVFAAKPELDNSRLWQPDPASTESTLFGPARYVYALDGSGYILHMSDTMNPFTKTSDVSNIVTPILPPTGPGTGEPVVDKNKDLDRDGLPDDWEAKYGLSNRMLDSRTDADGDGFSALEEFAANTNPADPASHPSLATLVRFHREESSLVPFELRKVSAPDAEDQSTWEIDIRAYAGGKTRDLLGLKLNAQLPLGGFHIKDAKLQFREERGLQIEDHTVTIANGTGMTVVLPFKRRVAQGDKTVVLYYLMDTQRRPMPIAPGGQVNLANRAGTTQSFTLSATAPYVLQAADGTRFPVPPVDPLKDVNRIEAARPAPPGGPTGPAIP